MPTRGVRSRKEAVQQAIDWFEHNSGWAPPDDDTLDEWLADGVCRCPDNCLVVPKSWCRHGLAGWDLILETVRTGQPPEESAEPVVDGLRYTEGPSTASEILITARPSKVWGLVTDIALPAHFSNEFQGAEWLDGATTPALGARFRGYNNNPLLGSWDTVSIVSNYIHGRFYEWSVGDVEKPAAVWRFEMEPDGRAGGVRLVMSVRMGPGYSGVSYAIDQDPDREDEIIRNRLAQFDRNMQATLTGIKTLAEAT